MNAMIRAMAVAAYEHEDRRMQLMESSSDGEDFAARRLEGQEEVKDDAKAEVEEKFQEQPEGRVEDEDGQPSNDESQSKVMVTTSRTVEETIRGTAHQFKSMTITFEIQDQDQNQDQDHDQDSEEEENIPFTAPTGVKADLNDVYEVFSSIAFYWENPEERKHFAEEFVRKCEEKGWI